MSDTPRTDLNHLTVETLRTMKGTGTKIVLASVARQLERELNAANERIKRLEEAGDRLAAFTPPSSDRFGAWRKAKEPKP